MTNEEKLESYNEINLAFASVSAYLGARHRVLAEEFGAEMTEESVLRDLVDGARDRVVELIVDHLDGVVIRYDQ